MRYLSVCSGIEAASVAWHPLGWRPVGFAEIEKFPAAVLAHHFPDVPNMGDMTNFEEWPDEPVDLLVGGTPCQSFSIAGLRAGLSDPRGNLMLTYGAIAAKRRPRWLVWENVPGVLSSNRGRDFASFLGLLGQLGYGWAYRVLDAQYVRVDGYPAAVPQRRRRVFVVGHLGDWRRAAAVLFDPASLSGDHPPRREAGKKPAPTISARPTGGGGLGTDFDLDGGLIPAIVPQAMSSKWAKGSSGPAGDEVANLIPVAHALRGEGFDASEDGTGRGTPLVPIDMRQASRGATMTNNRTEGSSGGAPGTGIGEVGDPSPTIAGSHVPAIAGPLVPVAYRTTGNDGAYKTGDVVGALTTTTDPNAQVVAFDLRGREGGSMPEGPHDTANIRAASGGSSRSYVALPWAVRRLTPVEAERLMGFPDNWTDIPWRGKPGAPDGPRYKALGNSMAVNVMRWIGRRIEMVEAAQGGHAMTQRDDAK